MTKKIISIVCAFVFVFMAVSFSSVNKAQAAVFPAGCSSAIGYSITNGAPCNGTATATMTLVGCSNAIGYSTVSGAPCSGSSQALFYLNGCSSTSGYSTITGAPCNGTTIATWTPTSPGTMIGTTTTTTTTAFIPGLPTTGAAPLSASMIALVSFFGMSALIGSVYFARRLKTA